MDRFVQGASESTLVGTWQRFLRLPLLPSRFPVSQSAGHTSGTRGHASDGDPRVRHPRGCPTLPVAHVASPSKRGKTRKPTKGLGNDRSPCHFYCDTGFALSPRSSHAFICLRNATATAPRHIAQPALLASRRAISSWRARANSGTVRGSRRMRSTGDRSRRVCHQGLRCFRIRQESSTPLTHDSWVCFNSRHSAVSA